jgi:cytochrome c-type biogenesis protein CcmH
MTDGGMGRREALRALALSLPALAVGRPLGAQLARQVDTAAIARAAGQGQAPDAQAPRAGQGEVGELFNPGVAGKNRTPTSAGDNSERYKFLEQKLQCTCGCTLDVFTCRTTDFTCEYSPALHREVLALGEQGKSDQQIVDAFVAKYGEKILMAPKPQGFNLAGYLVPGLVIALIGALLAWVIVRRVKRSEPALAGAAAGGVPVAPGPANLSDADSERLRRALEEIES